MRNKIKKPMQILLIIILVFFAIFFKFCLRGYSFLSIVLLFIAGVIGAYYALSLKDTLVFKRLKIILTCLVVLLVIIMTISEIPVISYMHKREKAHSDYCIVLGAGVHGKTPSRVLNQRINATYDFLTEYPEAKAILSGGKGPGEDITEASCMKEKLLTMGIDEDRLLLEENSTSTKENLMFSKKILDKIAPNTKEITVISSDTHLYRACFLANEEGFEAKGYYAYTDYHVLRFTYMLREGVAVWKEWIL